MKYLNLEKFLEEYKQVELGGVIYNSEDILDWEPINFIQSYEKWYRINEEERKSDDYGHATIQVCNEVKFILLNLRFLYANTIGIPGPFEGVYPEARRPNIFGDEIAFAEKWNFSRANLNEKNRIMAITQVASICYQSGKSLGSESLYNRLLAESHGLPSSSFEFVPMLLDKDEYDIAWSNVHNLDNSLHKGFQLNIEKFGEWIEDGKYLLTNFRAAVYDKENYGNLCDFTYNYNTEEECEIIRRHFNVFLYKVDFPTRSQMVRHRVNLQELSRRYVSGKRVPFDFYVSEKMKDITSEAGDTQKILDICLEHYYKALEDGVKPQEARRIIPQAGYTQLWGAFQPTQLANYFRLRDDSHAQWEIHQTAIAMKEMIISLDALQRDMENPERQAEILKRIEAVQNGTCEVIGTDELEKLLAEKEAKEAGESNG